MSLRDFTFVMNDISEYAYLLVAAFAFVTWLKFDRFKLLWIFLLLSGGIRVLTIFLAKEYINTHPYYHLLGLLELILVYWIYAREDISPKWRYFVPIAILAYLFNSIFIRSPYEMNSFALALVQITILSFGINYTYKHYATTNTVKNTSFFYISTGFMFYAVGSFFVNLLSSKIVSQSTNDFFHNAWVLEAFSALLRLSLISYGISLVYRER